MRWRVLPCCLLLGSLTCLVSCLGEHKLNGPEPEPLPGLGYYASPQGTSAGDGSWEQPWDLRTALAGAGGVIVPGDTVWVRGGRYPGNYVTHLEGVPGGYITFRQFPGERSTVDGQLQAGSSGAYLTFWGLEVMQSNPIGNGLYIQASHSRFINMVVHDAGAQGISFYVPAIDSEVHGCISYNNGTEANLDHGIYVHETDKRVEDCVFFNNMANGIHAHETNPQRNVVIRGNISFNNGTIDPQANPNGSNLLVRGVGGSSGGQVLDNILYFSREDDGENLRVGDGNAAHNQDIVVRGNYVVGGSTVLLVNQWEQLTVQDNVLIGSASKAVVSWGGRGAETVWSGNRWYRDPASAGWRLGSTSYDFAGWQQASGTGATDEVSAALPTVARVFVRPNKYEPGRAHIAVYNWGGQGTVAVDVAGVLEVGADYEVHNVQDLYGTPVASGVYAGAPLELPTSGVAPPVPLGRAAATPPRTAPAFDAFLLTSRPAAP